MAGKGNESISKGHDSNEFDDASSEMSSLKNMISDNQITMSNAITSFQKKSDDTSDDAKKLETCMTSKTNDNRVR